MHISILNKIIYLAGIIDGEGCIGLYNNGRSSIGKKVWMINLRVSTTDGRLADWLVNNFGGHVDLIRDNRLNHHDCYSWVVRGRFAINILKQVYPHLIIKKEQAQIAKDFEGTMWRGGHNGLPPEYRRIREICRNRLEELKQESKKYQSKQCKQQRAA